MKRFLISLLIMIAFPVYAQPVSSKVTPLLKSVLSLSQNKSECLVWISFVDKGKHTGPVQARDLLAERAINRRAKVSSSENLLDDTDLPVNSEYILTVEKAGARIKQKSKWLNSVSAYLTSETINKISAFPFVKEIDLVATFKRSEFPESKSATPSDTEPTPTKYSLNYGSSLTQNQQINVPAVHDLGITGQNVIVGVMDAGFNRLSHESFSTMNILAKWDFVNHDPGVGDSTDMGTGTHGTQTLSTIGGYKSGQLIGPAFGASYVLAKTENTDSETPVEEDNWIAAIEWADSIGVDVTSTSLGYIDFDPPFTSYTWQSMNGNTCRITIAADLAVKKGIVVLNSAGNEGFNSTHNTLGAPSDGDSVIAVGAVTSSGSRSSFSSVGNTVDGRTKPDVMAMGSSVRTASPYNNTGYAGSDGTSFSCPLAAGVAALILSARPHLTPMQVREAMRNTASQATSPNREYGWGILNALAAINYYAVPVELTSFYCYSAEENIQLKWTTASETNNKGFEILRSTDGTLWNPIGFVNGNGTTTLINNYEFNDASPKPGKNFYRLRQLDFSGGLSLSQIISAESNIPFEFTLEQNFPNPFNPSTAIVFYMPEEGEASLKVYDVLGDEIKSLFSGLLTKGAHKLEFNGEGLPSGLYICVLKSDGFTKQIKMSLLK